MSTVRRGDIVRALSERVVDALEGRAGVVATEGAAGLMAVRTSTACPSRVAPAA